MPDVLRPERITDPIMNFTAEFYRADVRRGVEAVRRRRCIQAELERANDRKRKEATTDSRDGHVKSNKNPWYS